MKNIKALIKNNEIKKILIFFSENPQSIDTAKGISMWTGCGLNAVQNGLKKLESEGILINHKTASINAYSYTNKRDVVKKVEKYIK